MKRLLIIMAAISIFSCKMGMNADAEVIVSVEASRYYCHECGYEWNGSTMTTVLCPRCESMRIEIIGEAE